MYSKYTYNAGSTAANIVADLVLILTGTTSVGALSGDVDAGNTTITATILADWVVHDSNSGTDAQVLKAEYDDDAASFKYVNLNLGTAGYIKLELWETWDAGLDSGTNMANNSNSNSWAQRVDLTAGGTIYIFASERFMMMVSSIPAGWGSSSGQGPTGVFERTRALEFDTVGAGYPRGVWGEFGVAESSSASFGYAPRLLDKDGITEETGSSALLKVGSVGIPNIFSSPPSGVDEKIPDGIGGFKIPFYPAYVFNETLMPAPYGELSSTCNIWKIPTGVLVNLQTVTKNSIDYITLKTRDSTAMMVVRAS